MYVVDTNGYSLEIGDILESTFAELLDTKFKNSKKVIITDENCRENCLEYLVTNFESLYDADVIMMPAGEETKQMDYVINVLEAFSEYGIGRHDLVVNLGGGVITDFGGFVASIYKRGCHFINIPTSLLAMVDASIGGKTGVNLGVFKNQIGVFSNPTALYIDTVFLQTLPEVELANGIAEMLKHGIIADKEHFEIVRDLMENGGEFSEEILIKSIEIKNTIVKNDPFEKGERKKLNFGHTIGHVIEGHYYDTLEIKHGHAVAIGMVMESYLSMKFGGLDPDEYEQLETFLTAYYPLPKLTDEDIQVMIEMLENDKKNKEGMILCTLVTKVGEAVIDQHILPGQFLEVFLHFKNRQLNLN